MPPTSRKSKLSAKTNKRRNTQTGRDKMKSSQFALPKGTGSQPDKDQYRIDDAAHARNAVARAAQFATPAEQAQVRRKVAAKFPGIDVTAPAKRKRKKQNTKGS